MELLAFVLRKEVARILTLSYPVVGFSLVVCNL